MASRGAVRAGRPGTPSGALNEKARVLQEDAGFFLSGRSLQQRQGVADDQAVLVLVALVVAEPAAGRPLRKEAFFQVKPRPLKVPSGIT